MGPRITVMLDRATDWDRMTALGDAITDVLMKEGFRIGLEHEVTNA